MAIREEVQLCRKIPDNIKQILQESYDKKQEATDAYISGVNIIEGDDDVVLEYFDFDGIYMLFQFLFLSIYVRSWNLCFTM